ncbi:MAG: molybdopterin molybdotransferase MoeA [Acidiferrobacterales bacterium]|nr:molybdopterin molybdotransferase MoeA [Acidiferrobacterales bacterium]
MLTVDRAQQKLIDSVACVCEVESVALNEALGRVSTSDVVSPIFVPPTDNSAMDGFAVKAADVSSKPLKISQRIPAGSQPNALELGTAARIFTGGVLPEGADAVVIQENCEYSANSDLVKVNSSVSIGDNIRPKGQDISQGSIVVEKNKRLNAIDLGLIASVGDAAVAVRRRLKVAIFSTGDELVEPGQTLAQGQIYNSNRASLAALCQQLGYRVVDCGIIEDTLEATKNALQSAANKADVVISSGGVSVGEEDHVKPAVEDLGSLDLWKVQMKPGKPVAFGKIKDTPFLGLPGNPVSSYIVFQLLAVPLLTRLQGEQWQAPTRYHVTSGFDKEKVSREEYIRVRLVGNDHGIKVAQRFDNQSSGVLTSLAWADGLLRQKIDEKIIGGELVEFLPLKQGLL